MTTIQLEADVSTEQLLRAVEQLPPPEFARFLVQLLAHARGAPPPTSISAAAGETRSLSAGLLENDRNPYLAAAGIFAADTFAAEVAAYITTQREREREEAARQAEA